MPSPSYFHTAIVSEQVQMNNDLLLQEKINERETKTKQNKETKQISNFKKKEQTKEEKKEM